MKNLILVKKTVLLLSFFMATHSAHKCLCAAVDYSNQDLTGRDLSSRDLIGSKFDGAILDGTNFSLSNLTDVDFSNATFRTNRGKTNFSSAFLNGAKFAPGFNFGSTILAGIHANENNNFRQRFFDDVNLSGAFLSHADFSGSSLGRAKLDRTQLWGTNFTGANLTNADLRGAHLLDTKFDQAILTGANFSAATVQNVDFAKANSFDAAQIRSQARHVSDSAGVQDKK